MYCKRIYSSIVLASTGISLRNYALDREIHHQSGAAAEPEERHAWRWRGCAFKPDGTVAWQNVGYMEGGPKALIDQLDKAKQK